MELSLQKGKDLVDSFYHSTRFGNQLLINLTDRWTYRGFKQAQNHLIIETTNGEAVFLIDPIVEIKFDHEEKEQIVFSVLQ